MKKEYVSVRFPKPKSVGERDWGKEDLLVLVPKKYSFKRMELKAGKHGGLQYHHKKNECGYMVSGELMLKYDDGDGNLVEKIVGPGAVYHFPPGSVHQTLAITDCVIIEASTPHFNDRVRVEEDYGLPFDGGLPSTTEDEVEVR